MRRTNVVATWWYMVSAGHDHRRREVEVAATGFVHGDIIAPRMMLAEGATLHGRIGTAATSSGNVRP